jgi:FKBP-type peptidyl-prolyl cis-trans isomerase
MKDHSGSSRQAIQKYIKSEFDNDNSSAFKRALKQGIADGILVQIGQSFKINGENYEEPIEDKLQIKDVIIGGGLEAEDGSAVTVSYVGKLNETGKQFDSATTFSFVLGAGEVIKGWDQGVKGMRVGGKRTLLVPPKLGYGKKGAPPDIPSNAALNFTVTLKDIQR